MWQKHLLSCLLMRSLGESTLSQLLAELSEQQMPAWPDWGWQTKGPRASWPAALLVDLRLQAAR